MPRQHRLHNRPQPPTAAPVRKRSFDKGKSIEMIADLLGHTYKVVADTISSRSAKRSLTKRSGLLSACRVDRPFDFFPFVKTNRYRHHEAWSFPRFVIDEGRSFTPSIFRKERQTHPGRMPDKCDASATVSGSGSFNLWSFSTALAPLNFLFSFSHFSRKLVAFRQLHRHRYFHSLRRPQRFRQLFEGKRAI